jgi:signal transduction histidine kinase
MKNNFFLLLTLMFLSKATFAQIPNVDRLKQKLVSATEDTARVNALWNLALAYVFSNPDTGANYARQGLELARKIGYKPGEAYCFDFLGLASNFSGDYTNALQYGLQSLSIFRDLQDTTGMVPACMAVMTVYKSLEDYDQVLKYSYMAQRLLGFSQSTFPKFASNSASIVCMITGTTYEKRNQLDSALYYTTKALTLDDSWFGPYLGIGEAYTGLGQYDSALHYLRNGINGAIRGNSLVFLTDLYNDMSQVFELSGHNDSSVYYAYKTIQQAGVMTITLEVLQASMQLAKLYELKGKPDSIIKYLKLAHILKDSLFSRKKTREAQNFAFNEVLHQQELFAQRQKEKSQLRIVILLVVLSVFLLIAFFLWRNNKQKQKANRLLESKNRQIENALKELKSTQSQLIQSEKMASLGELTAGIAHEIQNPLNFVNNFSEVNKELIGELVEEVDKGNTEEVKAIAKDINDNSEKINHHGKRADAIVKGMLQHSRASSGQKELTDINALCDEYLRLAYHGLRAKDKFFNAKFETDFDNSIGKINIIPQEIGRVILNLINNAFYAASHPSKGGLSDSDNGKAPSVWVSTKRENNKILISVRDNGAGIPSNISDKIFQPFFTTKPTGQGTGLGLSLSYDIVKAHGGAIKVETGEGEGSEFVVMLPC